MAPDRIPPEKGTDVQVTVAGIAADAPDVVLAVENQGGGNGTVAIRQEDPYHLRETETVTLEGRAQTEEGHAGNLRLVARQEGRIVAQSPGFSVAAIPQNWEVEKVEDVDEADSVGLRVRNIWHSDSDVRGHLDQVSRAERLDPVPLYRSRWKRADTGEITDTHTIGKVDLADMARFAPLPVTWRTQQTFAFWDRRTGAENVPARHSGFHIVRTLARGGAGLLGLRLTTEKIPHAGTGEGIYSEEGDGGARSGPIDV